MRRRIGLVFQEPTLDAYLTAEQNLRFHGELYGVDRATAAQRRTTRCWTMVGLWDRRGDLVQTFSGGMRRRLEIARGLLHSPRVLFLDEPTIGLDPQTRASIWDYLRSCTAARGHHRLRHHALHGRGRALRPHRDHDHGRIVALDTPDALKSSIGKDRVADHAPTTTSRPSPRCATGSGSRPAVHEGR